MGSTKLLEAGLLGTEPQGCRQGNRGPEGKERWELRASDQWTGGSGVGTAEAAPSRVRGRTSDQCLAQHS